MLSAEFKSSLVERERGRVRIVLFDGQREAVAVVLLRCSPDAARGLAQKIGSALAADASRLDET